MRHRLCIVVLSLLALACGGEDDPDPRVATDGVVFARGGTGIVPEAYVPFAVTNRGTATVFLLGCDGAPVVIIERGTGAKWEPYSGTGCIHALSQAPVELRAGQTITSHVLILDAGYFRIRAGWGPSPSGPTNALATSNTFTVR